MVHAISQDHGHDIDMHGYLSGSAAEEPADNELIMVERWSRTPTLAAKVFFSRIGRSYSERGMLSEGMAVSDSSCSNAVVAVYRCTSTSISDSANKLLISG